MSIHTRSRVAARTVSCLTLAWLSVGTDALTDHVGAAGQAGLRRIARAGRAVPAAGRT
jgi:hypothetical protein